MTRIESGQNNEREALKKEIVDEIRGDARRRKAIGCGSCALVWVLAILIGGWFVGTTLTKTGFVRVPYVPASVYVPEEPVRVVSPLRGTKPEDVPTIVGSRAKFETSTGKLSIPMKEADITTVVSQAFVAGIEGLPFAVERAQVAIESDHLELFLVSPQEGRKATVRVRFTPSVADGKVVLALRDIELGKVTLPAFVSNMAFNAVRTSFEGAIESAAAKVGEIRGIDLAKGQLTLTFSAPRQ